MASLLRLLRSGFHRAPAKPIKFPAAGFEVIPSSYMLEEEKFGEFKRGIYYPVTIGEVFASRYQVLGKLGFGVSSTVWLGYDLSHHQHVALKIYTREEHNDEEFKIYQKLEGGNHNHPGYLHVRRALDRISIPSPKGNHDCLILKPMWDSFKDMLNRNPAHRFTPELLKGGLIQLFRALDYLHTECQVIHTDIKADNILQEIEDLAILKSFTDAELTEPSPRKFVDGQTIYQSRPFDRPKVFGGVVLSDFGSAMSGSEPQYCNAQPNVYRSPEVMLKVPWGYPIDIWNVGVMIWDLFEDKHMFYGDDPDGKGYSTRAHLAEVVGMLGLPPLDLLNKGKRSGEFFTEEGQWKAEVPIPSDSSLESSEEFLEGEDKKQFLRFMRGMLQWRPEDRKTAKQLLEDPWLTGS